MTFNYCCIFIQKWLRLKSGKAKLSDIMIGYLKLFKIKEALARAFVCTVNRPTFTLTFSRRPRLTSNLMQWNQNVITNSTSSVICTTSSSIDQRSRSLFNTVHHLLDGNNKSNYNVNKSTTETFLLVISRFYSTKADNKDQGGNKVIGQLHFNMTEYNIIHNKKEHYFYIILQEGSCGQDEKLAKLEYAWVKQGVADLYHTEVPPEFQGRGIAKQLVLAGLDALCEENVFIRPTCPYVQKVLRENPVQQHLNHLEKGFKL